MKESPRPRRSWRTDRTTPAANLIRGQVPRTYQARLGPWLAVPEQRRRCKTERPWPVKDLTNPPITSEQMELGDGWSKPGPERCPGRPKVGLQPPPPGSGTRQASWRGSDGPTARIRVEGADQGTGKDSRRARRLGSSRPGWAPGNRGALSCASGPFDRAARDSTNLPTRDSYSGAVEITVVARTEAPKHPSARTAWGPVVIFNWENNPRQLRVHRPDGNAKAEKWWHRHCAHQARSTPRNMVHAPLAGSPRKAWTSSSTESGVFTESP